MDARRMVERLRAGDARALARAVSLVEDGVEGAGELLAECRKFTGNALRVGVTGSPGAGKSTLVDQMARWLRDQGKRVGVVAVDPTSPYTGGALLGDRIRMQSLATDEDVYVRSMASRGAMGGLAHAVGGVCDVIAASGREIVLIETVGVGQDEVEVAQLANVTVLVLVPGMGDEVQALKAGVMEVADIFVVNKSDCGGAEQVEAEIVAMQGLAERQDSWVAPVVRTVATTGEGIAGLMETVQRCAEVKRASAADRRSLRQAQDRLFDSASAALGVAQDETSFGITGAQLRLDHLGVAVKSIAGARDFYEMLGMKVSHEETVKHEQVRVAMLAMGESRLELLEPTHGDSVIGRFLAKRGEGLHHIALKVEDVDATFARLKENGVRLVNDEVRVGAGGHRYFFVHPASTGGVLMEIVGKG
ncbi:methylmalonyl Co-A mutase-associated GTPase MeaB [Edaphobacter albus]|uniref:methylmalonyl Co-A mutase-associated GTPase MeaB n=1 Tax=Edaphobacter sp. 4G125 TaxID=2763071 RepID=UPI0016488184|nr:methylmalonyl Co-A mutase-associated GTPase MeaB [Edaphobacter sp. 4G125]QNI38611.1 methylmalonyl Co-A mutase-associated GTPase MeaB [Edaphobacter sp. 4G125]